MSDVLSVREAARDAPRALALTEGTRRWTWREVAEEVDARLRAWRDADAILALDGAPTAERVLDVLAAIERRACAVMLHPRWSDDERARVRRAVDEAPHPHEGTLAVLFTSGTTGAPRGACLSRSAFVHAAHASAQILPLVPGDRWALAMPLAHVGGLSIVTRCLLARACIALTPSAPSTADLEGATRVSLVPTMLARLLDAGLAADDRRVLLIGGAACPERVLTRALERRLRIRTTYGLTEACSQVTTAREDVRGVEDGSGEPLPGVELSIVDGAICVRSPSLLSGWFPLGTHASPLSASGAYETGDLGALDERGRLHVHARRTDLVITGGENVYPAEIEAALERAPGVRAACVLGVPDDLWGQRVAAVIVGDASDTELRDALAPLARFKHPRLVARLDALVVAPSGKLDRAATARAAAALFRPLD